MGGDFAGDSDPTHFGVTDELDFRAAADVADMHTAIGKVGDHKDGGQRALFSVT